MFWPYGLMAIQESEPGLSNPPRLKRRFKKPLQGLNILTLRAECSLPQNAAPPSRLLLLDRTDTLGSTGESAAFVAMQSPADATAGKAFPPAPFRLMSPDWESSRLRDRGFRNQRTDAPPRGLSGPRTPLTPRYRPEPAAKIRRSRYKSTSRGTTNTRPHQRPVAQSTTTTAVIQTASSSRITSDDFRCRRSQFIVAGQYSQPVLSGIVR